MIQSTATRENERQIVVSGDAYEMGFTQGHALRDRIRQGRAIVDQLEAFRLMKPFWMPYGIFRKIAEKRAERALAPAFASEFPEYQRRLEGLSAGSGVALKELYLFGALESMLSEKGSCITTPPLGGCSALAVRASRSASGEPVIVRNFDYLHAVQPLYTMRKTKPRHGFHSLDFTMAPFPGAVDGVNEKGLCITYNYAYTTDAPRKPSVPISVVIAEALRQCSRVSEATTFIASKPRWGGGLLMLADADGGLASLELSSNHSAVRTAAIGEDLIFHTNAFWTREMRVVQVADNAIYTDQAPEPLRGKLLHESAIRRRERLQALTQGTSALSIAALESIMADHGPNGEPSDTSICVHSRYWSTTASLQLFPRTRRMRVAFDSACRRTYTEFEVR
jgi:hypothetical protein